MSSARWALFFLRKPGPDQVRRFLAAQRDAPFSYAAVGATRTTPPAGWTVDHNCVQLGAGPTAWAAARTALRRWAMFHLPWLRLYRPATPLEPGRVVALRSVQLGLWALSAARIVYVVDEVGPPRRYGFAYGTLPAHVARGEERFLVEWHADGTVWYDILSFSRPRHPLTWLGYPVARLFQRRFARASKAAMQRAVRGTMDDGRWTMDDGR